MSDYGIDYWRWRVELHEREVAAGLLRADADCLAYARAALAEFVSDVVGQPRPAASGTPIAAPVAPDGNHARPGVEQQAAGPDCPPRPAAGTA